MIVRDTRLEQARAALEDARRAQPPGLPRREMARHIRMLAERVASLSRECLRWRLQAAVQEVSEPAAPAEPGGRCLPRTPCPHTSHPTHWTKAWLRPTW